MKGYLALVIGPRCWRWQSWPFFLLLFVVAVSPVIPGWLDPRLPSTHEHFRYLVLSDWFLEASHAGN